MAFIVRPDRRETENKTIRFPVELIEKIHKIIEGKNVTFSGFIVQACEYALNSIEKVDDKEINL